MSFADTSPTTIVPPPVSNATPPTNPVNGQMWFNPITMAIGVWDGSVWKTVGSAGGGIVSGGVAPATPNIGDAWFNTTTGLLMVYDGANWKQVGAPSGSATAPATPSLGTVWIDSSTTPATVKTWNGASWVTANMTDSSSGSGKPVKPSSGRVWIDTNTSPAVSKVWDGSAWVAMAPDKAQEQALKGIADTIETIENYLKNLTWDNT